MQFSSGWHETSGQRKGHFETRYNFNKSWDSAVIQGPNFNIASPLHQDARPSMKGRQDYELVDLEALPENYVPATRFRPKLGVRFSEAYPKWHVKGDAHSSRSFFRIVWRNQADPMMFRTFIPALIPPGATHVDAVMSAGGFEDQSELYLYTGLFSSLPYDFLVRAQSRSKTNPSIVNQLPRMREELPTVEEAIVRRSARLVSLTVAYADLWREVFDEGWTASSPERNAEARRMLLIELDVLAAMNLGMSVDELCVLYTSQFPVLRFKHEGKNHYDANGRLVPNDIAREYRKHGEDLPAKERQWTHPQSGVEYIFEFPFRTLNREQDYRDVWAKF